MDVSIGFLTFKLKFNCYAYSRMSIIWRFHWSNFYLSKIYFLVV